MDANFFGLFSDRPEDRELPGGKRVERAGILLQCSHCGGDAFYEGSAQLHTAGLTFLQLEWLSGSATYYACACCGHLHWFVDSPR